MKILILLVALIAITTQFTYANLTLDTPQALSTETITDFSVVEYTVDTERQTITVHYRGKNSSGDILKADAFVLSGADYAAYFAATDSKANIYSCLKTHLGVTGTIN